ncbi:alpha/beta hydrolase [Latilactobacillus graminis]|uniref:X-Pro dipeptidyl-peptidase family protein n=2 Tax=Latilactobacillus graminis TaxID=60519 RepID=A0AA89L4V2_9LACO|nr:alpha/beta hydrolase [Latilactobacillus graminis]KRM22477.1 X-Pro dipeptidyl-peptidase family protein [Latilactobacillus graminis DSM 20719]QFP79357.1 alpha/beta hydrolase [Latilactobacillus graminis]
MKKRRWLKWSLISAIALVVVVLWGATMYMYQYAFVPGQKSFLNSGQPTKVYQANQRWLKNVKQTKWYQQSATDHLKLTALYVPAAQPTSKTILVAHGYMGKKEDMARYIHLYHDLGYNVLAPDDRASGESEGHAIGYGWTDRLDYVKWTKQVVQKNGQQSQIGLFGVSMGGATVMMTAGEKLPVQVKAVVEDCGYSSIEGELAYQLNDLFGLPKFPIFYTTNLMARARAGYNFFDGDATKSLAKSKIPIFFIHGGQDKFVPTKMVYENYAAANQPKKLWVVKGAGHAKAMAKQPKLYRQKVGAFFEQYFK